MLKKYAEDNVRPQYVMESFEDLIYHNNGVETEPELCAFTGRMMVFNRTMKWLDEASDDGLDGCIICYSEAGDLPLTGEKQASAWHSDPVNEIRESGDFTTFSKKSAKRKRDCAVLPGFQFHLGQHPVVELTVSEATDDWQFCIFVKGRSGAPVISSGWKRDKCTMSFDIAAELKKKGFNLQFAELHFVVGTWNENPETVSSLTYKLSLKGQPAIVSCLPVIRTSAIAEAKGVPVAAVAVDAQGARLRSGSVKVYAFSNGQRIPFAEKDGIWKARLHGLKQGDFNIELFTEGAVRAKGFVNVRVTDGKFISYDREDHSLEKEGRITGPLSGSYQGMVFFKNAGLDTEKMVNGQQAWDSWDRTQPPGEHWHYWEGMTEAELDERFSYLEECGWNILHLCQHYGNWGRLDAGGRIAPHGAEQLALYMRTAARHGLVLLQALSHYAYGTLEDAGSIHSTVPFNRYFEEGFKSGDWINTDNHFTEVFHGYLRHYTGIFKDETALFAMTASGEGDWVAKKDRVNDTYNFVKSLDENHMFIAEPIFRIEKLPQDYFEGWQQELFGSRVYWAGDKLFPEYDLGTEFKFMQLGPVFMGEGSWPCFPKYAENNSGNESWCGTLRYRNRLRDSIYLALVHRIPMILTWDEQIAEDERAVFNEIRKMVNWEQSFMKPGVALKVDEANVMDEGRKNLTEYEKFFAALPLAYRLVLVNNSSIETLGAEKPGMDAQSAQQPDVETSDVIIDARLPFKAPGFESEGGILPDSLKGCMPLNISEGYCSNYLWSEDRQTLLAYVYNCTNHMEAELELAGKYHRIPDKADLKLALQNLPDKKLRYRIYDLNDKVVIKEGIVQGKLELDIGNVERDYFIVVIP